MEADDDDDEKAEEDQQPLDEDDSSEQVQPYTDATLNMKTIRKMSSTKKSEKAQHWIRRLLVRAGYGFFFNLLFFYFLFLFFLQTGHQVQARARAVPRIRRPRNAHGLVDRIPRL